MTSRLLLAHPEPFFRECLGEALAARADLEVAAAVSDEKEAADLAGASSVDVVVTAPVLDAGSGLGLARRIGDSVPVVVLTPEEEADALLAAVEAGASGCVSHATGTAVLGSVLASVRPGRFVVDPDRLRETLKKIALTRSGGGPRPSPLDVLSAREREILGAVAEGLDNDAIAERFYLSPNTVRTHVGNVLKKLGVHSRAEAARLALRDAVRTEATQVLHVEGPDLSPT